MKAYIVDMRNRGDRREVEIGGMESLVVVDDHGNEISVEGGHRWGLQLRHQHRRLVPVQEAANSLGIASLPLEWDVCAEREGRVE